MAHRYYVTRPNGNIDDIGAYRVLFDHDHVLFVDENLRPVVVLHAEEVREIEFEWDEDLLAD